LHVRLASFFVFKNALLLTMTVPEAEEPEEAVSLLTDPLHSNLITDWLPAYALFIIK